MSQTTMHSQNSTQGCGPYPLDFSDVSSRFKNVSLRMMEAVRDLQETIPLYLKVMDTVTINETFYKSKISYQTELIEHLQEENKRLTEESTHHAKLRKVTEEKYTELAQKYKTSKLPGCETPTTVERQIRNATNSFEQHEHTKLKKPLTRRSTGSSKKIRVTTKKTSNKSSVELRKERGEGLETNTSKRTLSEENLKEMVPDKSKNKFKGPPVCPPEREYSTETQWSNIVTDVHSPTISSGRKSRKSHRKQSPQNIGEEPPSPVDFFPEPQVLSRSNDPVPKLNYSPCSAVEKVSDAVSPLESETQNRNQDLASSTPATQQKKNGGLDFNYQETVLNRSERRQLVGNACPECVGWFGAMEKITGVSAKQRIQEISRHRCTCDRPREPPDFFDIGFPNTQDDPQQAHLRDVPTKELKTRKKNEKPTQTLKNITNTSTFASGRKQTRKRSLNTPQHDVSQNSKLSKWITPKAGFPSAKLAHEPDTILRPEISDFSKKRDKSRQEAELCAEKVREVLQSPSREESSELPHVFETQVLEGDSVPFEQMETMELTGQASDGKASHLAVETAPIPSTFGSL
eukprot:m.284310 g.284310  ORF g.284310 m.284310 type:complete len:575 (-) comp16339_c3_seq31:2721-4445(-)